MPTCVASPRVRDPRRHRDGTAPPGTTSAADSCAPSGTTRRRTVTCARPTGGWHAGAAVKALPVDLVPSRDDTGAAGDDLAPR